MESRELQLDETTCPDVELAQHDVEMLVEVGTAELRVVCETCQSDVQTFTAGHLVRPGGQESGFRCLECYQIVDTAEEMAAHAEGHREPGETQCKRCRENSAKQRKRRRPQSWTLSREVDPDDVDGGEAVDEVMLYACWVCPSDSHMYTIKELVAHLILQHASKLHANGQSTYFCQLCKKSYQRRQLLEVHLRTHFGLKPFKCDQCGKRFSQRVHFQAHQRTHTSERPFKCDLCSSSFRQQGHLQAHMRLHTGDKPYRCNLCEREFTQSGHLSVHMQLHERPGFKPRRPRGQKPTRDELTCSICGKHFVRVADLERHRLIHEPARYRCELCPSRFRRHDHLVRHTANHRKKQPTARGNYREKRNKVVLEDPLQVSPLRGDIGSEESVIEETLAKRRIYVRLVESDNKAPGLEARVVGVNKGSAGVSKGVSEGVDQADWVTCLSEEEKADSPSPRLDAGPIEKNTANLSGSAVQVSPAQCTRVYVFYSKGESSDQSAYTKNLSQ